MQKICAGRWHCQAAARLHHYLRRMKQGPETDLPGRAIADLFYGRKPARLWVHDQHGPKVEMVTAVYFRDRDSMSELESIALKECAGKVLDIGAAAGSHALALQEAGLDVTALDISPQAAAVMRDRGVVRVLEEDVFTYRGDVYDTLLLLMNGIGLCATLTGLRTFLQQAKSLLRPGGQLLFDSSDVAYLYEDEELPFPQDHYYGEIRCRYGYKRSFTDWFTWLYVDQHRLRQLAEGEGWKVQLLYEEEDGQYLVRLRL